MPIRNALLLSLWATWFASPVVAEEGDCAGPGCGVPEETDSVIGQNDLEDIEAVWNTVYYDMARPVARVENLSRDGFCTGVRVGTTLMLTNYHCWEAAGCRVRFRLGFERSLGEEEQALYNCVAVVAKAHELDFALYRVRAVYPNQIEYPVATLTKKPLVIGQELVAPGHPMLLPKQIDVSPGCRVTRAEPYVHEGVVSMQHQCDTQGGSSGSPLMDRISGHLVALHWGAAGSTGANHGVPMDQIIQRIGETDPMLLTEMLISEY